MCFEVSSYKDTSSDATLTTRLTLRFLTQRPDPMVEVSLKKICEIPARNVAALSHARGTSSQEAVVEGSSQRSLTEAPAPGQCA